MICYTENMEPTKRCSKCESVKPITGFSHNKSMPDGFANWCKECVRQVYWSNPEKPRERARRFYRQHPEERKAYSRSYHRAHRDEVLEYMAEYYQSSKLAAFDAYGGARCACCGETQIGFLSLDHINGCTKETRKIQGLGGRLYQWLKKQGYPLGYQVLCFNCNLGRAHNHGVCPHKA